MCHTCTFEQRGAQHYCVCYPVVIHLGTYICNTGVYSACNKHVLHCTNTGVIHV